MQENNTIEAHGLAEARALSRGPAYQAPETPAAEKLYRIAWHLEEQGITPARRAALLAWQEELEVLAAEEAEFTDFPDDDREALAAVGCIGTRAEEMMAAA